MTYYRAQYFIFFSFSFVFLNVLFIMVIELYNSSPDASIEIILTHPSANFPRWTLGVFLPHTCISALLLLTCTHLAEAHGSCLSLTSDHFSSADHHHMSPLPILRCSCVLHESVPCSLEQTSAMWPPWSKLPAHSPFPPEWTPWGCNWENSQSFLLLVVSQKEVSTRRGSR